MEPDNSQQIDRMKWYACSLATYQKVSVLASSLVLNEA